MKRPLGNTGLTVEPIGLGGMPLSIQNRPDERTALAVIEAFVAGGGDHIDTASSYCLDDNDFGHNERLIAKALRNVGRTDIVVATKGGLTRPNGRWEVDCRPQWLRHCCEQSVQTLGAPIPLYYLHTVDPAVPLGEARADCHRLGLRNLLARQRFLVGVSHRHADPVVGAPAQTIVLHLLRMIGCVECVTIELRRFAEVGSENAQKHRPALLSSLDDAGLARCNADQRRVRL